MNDKVPPHSRENEAHLFSPERGEQELRIHYLSPLSLLVMLPKEKPHSVVGHVSVKLLSKHLWLPYSHNAVSNLHYLVWTHFVDFASCVVDWGLFGICPILYKVIESQEGVTELVLRTERPREKPAFKLKIKA